ncbi:helix-turn-helix transcriptional regulator [Celeribacter indicus]|nr:AraC family transcriptional regulator [Celeribacter indicus]
MKKRAPSLPIPNRRVRFQGIAEGRKDKSGDSRHQLSTNGGTCPFAITDCPAQAATRCVLAGFSLTSDRLQRSDTRFSIGPRMQSLAQSKCLASAAANLSCKSAAREVVTGKAAEAGRKMSDVTLFSITQASAAIFHGLYIGQTFLCVVRAGTKKVLCPVNGEMTASEGDLIVFPPESFVTLENRPLRDAAYRADGAYLSHDLLLAASSPDSQGPRRTGIRILPAAEQEGYDLFAPLAATVDAEDLPEPIRRHRLMEPLIWLRHHGLEPTLPRDDHPIQQVRRLVETDLTHDWRLSEIARRFAMSEATLRRRLAAEGQGFAKILHNARLERGLGLLQTTELPISRIALESGFGTPSHFSDSFRKRFGMAPKAIRSAGD